eukprot:10746734-Alexandrium_andersonii.AAC.1
MCIRDSSPTGRTIMWTDPFPASPTRPPPRPIAENCWQGDAATADSTPANGALSTTFRSLAPCCSK